MIGQPDEIINLLAYRVFRYLPGLSNSIRV